MCLHVNKTRTQNKPKTVRTYYKVVRCYKGNKSITAPYQETIIKSGWYTAHNPWDLTQQNPIDFASINGQVIHVYCTRKAAEKLVKTDKNKDLYILEVKCYPEDFVAYGDMNSVNRNNKTANEAAYTSIFIQEDDVRTIIRNRNRKR